MQVCEKQKDGQFPEKWDESRQVPYAVQGDQWISYDNPRSIKGKVRTPNNQFQTRKENRKHQTNKEKSIKKCELRLIYLQTKLARQYGLAGVMVWSLESDDFKNYCPHSGGAYPLLRAAYRTLQAQAM